MLVHLLFALEYAKLYYLDPHGPAHEAPPGGLDFPGGHLPDYSDLLYFSFIIGVACQTADVDDLRPRGCGAWPCSTG